jgi:hypothetical protein
MSRTTPNGPEPNPNARFPEQLHSALSEMASEGLDYIASWQPHGRSFKIHDTQAFVQLVLERYVVVFPTLFHIDTCPSQRANMYSANLSICTVGSIKPSSLPFSVN